MMNLLGVFVLLRDEQYVFLITFALSVFNCS